MPVKGIIVYGTLFPIDFHDKIVGVSGKNYHPQNKYKSIWVCNKLSVTERFKDQTFIVIIYL